MNRETKRAFLEAVKSSEEDTLNKKVKSVAKSMGIPYSKNLYKNASKWMRGINVRGEYESNHPALAQECEQIGLPAGNVSSYWYKGKHFSIHVKGNNEDPIQVFKDYIEEARQSLSNSFTWQGNKAPKLKTNKLFVPAIFDLHLGKLAWGEETGEDYDIKIAEARFNTALDDLISKCRSHSFERVLFIVGNDVYNSDKAFPFGQTTAGTAQHDDIRWQKLFRMGIRLMTQAVEKLSHIAHTDVVTVFSNHDYERVFYLGEVLDAVFANHPNVTVDNSPSPRKYYQFGCNLLGLAHGHNEKPEQLPLLMAQEASDKWSATWYREWLLGHLHHKKQLQTQTAKDYNGVKVTYLTSPSSADAWHASRGFKGSIKGAEAFVYDAEEGLVATAIHNIK